MTKVVTRNNGRVLFEGTEEDARTYVERNFPRAHAENFTDYGADGPQTDVILDNGASYNGEWSDAKKSEPRKAPAKKVTTTKARR